MFITESIWRVWASPSTAPLSWRYLRQVPMLLPEDARSVVKSALGGMEVHPSNLAQALEFYSSQRGVLCTVAMLQEHLAIADPNDDIRQLATKRFQHWDFVKDPK